MFKVIRQKDQTLETILAAENLAAQAEEANAQIGETQNVNTDQDEVSAMIYEELLAAQETIATQDKTIKSLKSSITSQKKTIDELVSRVEAIEKQSDEEVSGNE